MQTGPQKRQLEEDSEVKNQKTIKRKMIMKMMESNDSRPFAVFRQNLEQFKSMLDADVSHCLDTLDPKVLELVGSPLKSHMEIAKAKQDINFFMKDMINEIGEQWMQHLVRIRDNLIENVEGFLAGIQLEPTPATSAGNGTCSPAFLNSIPGLEDFMLYVSRVSNHHLPATDLQEVPSTSEVQNVTSIPALNPIQNQTTPPELGSQDVTSIPALNPIQNQTTPPELGSQVQKKRGRPAKGKGKRIPVRPNVENKRPCGEGTSKMHLEGEDDCSICTEDMSRYSYKAPCGHRFHFKCIKKWLEKKNNCPICRNYLQLQDDSPDPS